MKKPLILRNRDILFIWLGQLLSQGGIRMMQIALVWWIVSAGGTHSGRDVGLFMIMGALPSLLLVKFIGDFVDRHRSKPILIGCDLLAGAASLAVAAALILGSLNLYSAMLGGFIIALFQAFFNPTLNRAVAEACDPADIESAVALQTSTQSLASFGGAMAGALLIDRLGIPGVVILNAVSYLVSAALNALLVLPHASPKADPSQPRGPSGWEIISGMPLVKRVLLGFGAVNFFLSPILLVLPLYVKEVLGGGPSLLGLLEASFWIGLLAGTLTSKWWSWTENLVRIGAVCIAVMGTCLLIPGFIPNFKLYLAALFATGAALGVNNVKFISLFQGCIPQRFKGRFFALLQAICTASFPLAYFAFGLLSDWINPSNTCLIQGAGTLILAVYFLQLSTTPDASRKLRAFAAD